VLVSNHVSTADLLFLFQRPQRYIHLITSALPQQVYACKHLPAILQPANKQTYTTLAEAQQQQQQQQPAATQGITLHTTSPHNSSSSSSGLSNGNGGEAGVSHHSLQAASAMHLQQLDLLHEQHTGNYLQQQQQHSGAAQQQEQQPSVHLFPEGGMTNGKGMRAPGSPGHIPLPRECTM
jgi:hypothetical protein